MNKILNILAVSVVGVSVVLLAGSFCSAQMPYTTTKTDDCGAGVGAPRGRDGLRRIADPEGGWETKGFVLDSFGPMPQTAYDPNFGCYPGNARTIHRYPAFHGNYYSTPTHFREYAEYPWNATIAEPRPYPNNALMGIGTEVVIPESAVPQGQSVIISDVPQAAPGGMGMSR